MILYRGDKMRQLHIRRISLVISDVVMMNVTFILTLLLHYEGHVPYGLITKFLTISVILTWAKVLINHYFRLYNSIWEYASIEEFINVVAAVSLGNLMGIIYYISVDFTLYPGIYLMAFVFEIAIIGGIRFMYRVFRRVKMNQSIFRQVFHKNILIVGSGSTGTMIAREIIEHPDTHGRLIGFIDKDPIKYKKSIAGVRVQGNPFDICSVVKRYNVDEIIIAQPQASPKEMNELLEECKLAKARVRIVPGVREIIEGRVSMNTLRDVEIEDLLGRKLFECDVELMTPFIEGKTVLVTGGGGTIGSELCRQICRFNPQKLIILDIYENNVYDTQNRLKKEYPKVDLDVIIGTIRDRESIFKIMKAIRPDVVFHAAAHKHVQLMERCPKEAIKNNTFGTMNLVDASVKYSVKRFVLVSTDKAVNPTNIVGASKRLCEMIIQGHQRTNTSTKFSAVRFGNVLGGNGSVIPLFRKQIEKGGPVTVTHDEVERYFMTVTEATQMIIQAGALSKGGEVFVIDMGEPVKIYDLALDLIRLSGLVPFKDINIEIIGLRNGEKLYEELLQDEETLIRTEFSRIHIEKSQDYDYKQLKPQLRFLQESIDELSDKDLISKVRQLVSTYKTMEEISLSRLNKVANLDNYRTHQPRI